MVGYLKVCRKRLKKSERQSTSKKAGPRRFAGGRPPLLHCGWIAALHRPAPYLWIMPRYNPWHAVMVRVSGGFEIPAEPYVSLTGGCFNETQGRTGIIHDESCRGGRTARSRVRQDYAGRRRIGHDRNPSWSRSWKAARAASRAGSPADRARAGGVARLRLKNGQASNSRHEGCGSYKLPPGEIAYIVRIM
jgi:hypothetical protein